MDIRSLVDPWAATGSSGARWVLTDPQTMSAHGDADSIRALFCAVWQPHGLVVERQRTDVLQPGLDSGAVGQKPVDILKTVTDRHIAGIAVRNQQIVSAALYYGVSLRTCVPADPNQRASGVDGADR